MAYVKQTWADNDPTKTLSAARMTHIEDGIAAADAQAALVARIDALEARIEALEG